MAIYNKERVYKDGITQKYPLFLGEELSLSDGVECQYPILEDLILKQRSQFWHERTIDMSNDRVQFPTLPKSQQDISVLNLAWQAMGDSIAGRAPLAALMPFVTNPQLEELLCFWQTFEQIHSRTYQHIIKTVFPNPTEVLNRVAAIGEAVDRLDVVTREFEKLETMGAWHVLSNNPDFKATANHHGATRTQIFKQIIKAVGALYAMESVQFMSSFACTFALGQQKVMEGTCDQVKKIAKDEKLHISFGKAILDILADDPETSELVEDFKPELKAIMDEVVAAEKKWPDYLFSEGRAIVGLNATISKEYVDYVATKAYSDIGLVYDNPVTAHPIPWVEGYLNPEMVQVAPQERDVTNYTIGSVVNDLDTAFDSGCMGFASADFLDLDDAHDATCFDKSNS